MELTDEQIAKLTPEQIEMIEKDESKLDEILAGQEKAPEASEDKPEQEEEDSAANGAGEEDGQEQEDSGEEEEKETEPVVLTKSGKGTIPYEKHKALRVENAELRDKLQALQKAQSEIESLQDKQAKATTPERIAEIQKKIGEKTALLKEDFQELGEFSGLVNEAIADLAKKIEEDRAENRKKAEEAKRKAEEEAAEQARLINEQVQEAKENNPDLVHWEANDPDAWEEAMLQDEALRLQPKWAKKSYEERFAEVVKRVRAFMPEASEPQRAEPEEKTREKAKAKLEKAAVRKPTTLSDIKGGANPASEREQLENLSPFELTQKLMQMPASQAAAMRADLD